jgi:hypothetical protein
MIFVISWAIWVFGCTSVVWIFLANFGIKLPVVTYTETELEENGITYVLLIVARDTA